MNKIFKVIWSRTKNCYVTASELAKGHTKSASTGSKARRKLLTSAAALAMVLTFAGGGNAWASVTVNTTDPGTPATVYTTEEVDNALGEKANSTDVASTYATKTEVADTYATKTALTEGLAEKANSDDVANTYATKSELESGLADKADSTTVASTYATKSELQSGLADKADSTTVASTYATKSEVENTYATKTALTEGLAEKANSDDVANTYATKSELESGLDGKLDVSEDGDVSVSGDLDVTGDISGSSLDVGNGDISGGQIIGTGLDAGAGTIETTGAVEAGTLTTTGAATIGGTLTSNGITNTGNTKTDSLTVANDASVGGNLTVTGDISGSSLDVGSGTIETTGAVEAGTLETTGDASIGGNLTVEEDLTVDGEFNANTITSKLGLNNYTEIQGGNVTSVNSKLSIDDGITYTSTSTLTERGKTETAANGTTRNVDKMDAAESSNVITNDSIGQTSTFRQRVDEILNQLNTSETTFSRVDQQVDTITNEVQDGENSTSTTQTAEDITNTAEQGTITNNANALVNTASNTISNEAVNDITTTSTAGNISNTAENGTISNTAQNITNEASENMTNTIGENLTTTVGGDMSTEVTGNQTTTIGGNQTTTVTGDSSLTAGNIINEAKNKITNNAVDVETTASSSIVSKVSNDYGSNTSTQLSSQTEETMSQSDGKTASYLRGAAEEKSLLTDGSTKTTIDTIAGQTNTNITDGSNISNNLQKADQLASSVTDGTNTTVANQDAQSLASSITDGTKFNNTNSTVDKSEQLIKSSDTQYNASVKTATTTTERMVSGSIIDILKDADNGYINTTVTQGDNSTGVKRTSQDITQTAKQGTITNDAKNLVNTAEESMTNTAGTQIQDVVGNTTVTTTTEGTTFENADHNAAIGEGSITKTTISGNTLETGKATMDYAEVTKDLTVGGTTTTKDLHVTNNASVDGTLDVGGAANFQDSVTIAKDLSAGGNASIAGSVTAASYKVGNKTYIDDNGIHANNQKITNVAPGELSADSLDAVNGAQLYETNQRVASMDSRINEVGANAAAMANLHPLEFDADSKLNVAAAVGNYKNKTATALGLFYRPNEDVMFNVSGTVGSSDNMVGGGVAIRIGHGGNKARNKQMAENAAYVKGLESRVDKLQQQMDALLSVLNPNLSKDFPDVPENHWAYEAVSRLAGNGIIQGYEDGKYHGERTMTRYEMAEIIYKALSKGAEAEAELVEEFRPELQAMAAQNKA